MTESVTSADPPDAIDPASAASRTHALRSGAGAASNGAVSIGGSLAMTLMCMCGGTHLLEVISPIDSLFEGNRQPRF